MASHVNKDVLMLDESNKSSGIDCVTATKSDYNKNQAYDSAYYKWQDSDGDFLEQDFGDSSDESEAFSKKLAKRLKADHSLPVPESSDAPALMPSNSASIPKPNLRKTRPKKADTDSSRPDGHGKIYRDTLSFRETGIRQGQPPMTKIQDMMDYIMTDLMSKGLGEYLQVFGNRPLNIATMCSGTEAPLFILRMADHFLVKTGSQYRLRFNHLFSAEIEAWKQHFILANFPNATIFRDVVQFLDFDKRKDEPFIATTAHGAKIALPGNPGEVDILIAGFCCVDFSGLNNKRKTMEDRGESGDTFYAILAYAKTFFPKLIILENIAKAPWKDEKCKPSEVSIPQHLRQIGYFSCFLELNTRDYFIPQTRMRGYLLAGSEKYFDELRWDALAARFKELMKDMQFPATAAVENFLLKSDDPILRRVVSSSGANKSAKRSDWDRCEVGHDIYRHDLGLGKKRTLTLWSRDGTPKTPDFYMPLSETTNRIYDTLDIAHIRDLRRGIDDRYYSRNLDLSQNVFRNKDSSKAGIIGCYTPNGIPFSTTRGSKIIGREGLILQGLPVDQIDISQLTDNQLQDLAGNAMSTTVVGSFMLAALTIFRDSLTPKDDRLPINELPLTADMFGEHLLVKKMFDPTSFARKPLRDILRNAVNSIRLCYCEGRLNIVSHGIRKCRICHHTICDRCTKNPCHDYEALPQWQLDLRTSPQGFESYIKAALPMKISFQESGNDFIEYLNSFRHVYEKCEKSEVEVAVNLIKKALESEVCYQSARRREVWEVEYHSGYSMLRLILSPAVCEWQLFVKPCSTMSNNNSFRLLFEKFPFCKMNPTGDVVIEGRWKVWVPQRREFGATIKSSGGVVPSFGAQAGLVKASMEYVHTRCNIEMEDREDLTKIIGVDVSGDYVLHQNCGQASNSLHKKIQNESEQPDILFYLDHAGQTGDPRLHEFVFTDDIRRLDYAEYRHSYAHIKWRQPLVKKNSVQYRKVAIIVDGYWIDLDDFQITRRREQQFEYFHMSNSPTPDIACNSPLAAFCCMLPLHNIELPVPRNSWIEIVPANEVEVFDQIQWAIANPKVIDDYLTQNLARFENWHTIRCDQVHCNTCAPKLPNLLWAYPRKLPIRNKPKQIAFEDPATASQYENALKTRPSGISILYRITENFLELKVGINPTSLCHRAVDALKPQGAFQTSWYLVTDDTSSKAQSVAFELSSSENEKPAKRPANFAGEFFLRPEQAKALAWMIKQERGVCFAEREFVEARKSRMGYLLMAQAWQDRCVRGGILASEVGFGKTIVIIAMILNRRVSDQHWANSYTGNLIPTAASIIFVPGQLPKQWFSEIKKFVACLKPEDIIVIETNPQLGKFTVGDFKEAKIVLVSFAVAQTDTYLLRLATLTGLVEPDSKGSPRVKDVWHSNLRRAMMDSIKKLRSSPSEFQAYLDNQFDKNSKEAEATILPIPSKRKTGSSYQNRKRNHDEMNGRVSEKPLASELKHKPVKFKGGCTETDMLLGPAFEMFAWSRVVIDEFTYLEARANPTMVHLEANSRWALSGTAPYESYAGIRSMADFIGVNLGRLDYSQMAKDAKASAQLHMTPSEKLAAFQGVASAHLVERREAQARHFCDVFVRRDFAKISPIKQTTAMYLLHQPITEAIAYLELEQRILAKDFDPKANAISKSDMEEQFCEVLAGATVRESLLNRASQYSLFDMAIDIDKLENRAGVNGKALYEILRQRQSIVQKLEGNPGANAMDLFNKLRESRKLEYEQNNAQLAYNVDIAVRLDNLPEYGCPAIIKQLEKWLEKNDFGDADVTEKLSGYLEISIARRDPHNSLYLQKYSLLNKKDKKGNPILVKDLKDKDAAKILKIKVKEFADEAVIRIRSLRLLNAYFRVHQKQINCDICRRGLQVVPLNEFTLLSSCGHLLCRCHFFADVDEMEIMQCPVDGCHAAADQDQMVHADEIQGKIDIPFDRYGEKLRQVTEVIKGTPNNDQVVLFVQTELQRVKAVRALKYANISFTDLKSGKLLSTQLNNFQYPSTSTVDKVLILNIGDQSAAGSNLTMANHLIFLAPYLTVGSTAQAKYEAAMKQAIGRVARYGQSKTVMIHKFLTVNTIDVDIYEHRTGETVTETLPNGNKVTGFGSRLAKVIFREELEAEQSLA